MLGISAHLKTSVSWIFFLLLHMQISANLAYMQVVELFDMSGVDPGPSGVEEGDENNHIVYLYLGGHFEATC